MLVYGDPGYTVPLGVLLHHLRQRVKDALLLEQDLPATLDLLRGLLIYAGQMEQAVWDDLPTYLNTSADRDALETFLALTQQITSELATALLFALTDSVVYPADADAPRILGILHTVLAHLDAAVQSPSLTLLYAPLRVKLPEGFAFYALYPEQYAWAARLWAAQHTQAVGTHVLVVGIRSIGTSLAALVSQTLVLCGWQTHCITVRPAGHPFARHIEGVLAGFEGAEYALIVDEGPGMSGSSMASAAQALKDSGMDAANIAFLPGHANDPGGKGDENVKRWWAVTPRYVAQMRDIRWNGNSLRGTLAARAAQLTGAAYDAARVHREDFSGGLWRRAVYASEQEWPAVCAAFESPKHQITLADGTRVLWKFAGLATDANGATQGEAMYQTLMRRSEAGWTTAAPLGTSMGFVALPWIEETPLVYADATPDVLRHIGRYIAAVRAPFMTPLEHDAALTRLADMLYWNVWEALGEEQAIKTRIWSDIAHNADWLPTAPTYGDGRMMPHKWLRLPDGTLSKTDAAGHDADHTVVGRQCWLWDVAGVIIEWRLNESQADVLLRAALTVTTQEDEKQEGATREDKTPEEQTVTPAVLAFYCMAYDALRVGQTHLCAQMSGHDLEEQARLWQAYEAYRTQLQTLLAIIP